ncbi:MAG: FHA domain-containing protein [Rhodocyclaceae bacterium]|nr:MAG: FHA domain-containing protein [Rhodocyclaceae bacterium]
MQVVELYVFLGGITLVLIGIVVTLIRRHSQIKRHEAAMAKPSAAAVPRSGPAPGPPAAAFDPAATRIHFRESPPAASTALLKRDEAALPADGAPRLVCVGGTRKGSSFPVIITGTTVGRDPNNDIVIADPRVSYRHAWIGIIDRKVVLRDLGSTNGTFLNAKMDTLVSEVALSPGDTIFFGGHGAEQFRFVVD